MASAKPIIAAKHGGLTEIVIHDQTGWLIPPCNAEALADALQLAVTQSDLRERLGAAGLARYHAEFTLARQMDHVASVYEEVLR
jgi:glycosyltransferase involved in cell wall biosynthesis